jgi:hypothetical protein
MFSFYHSVGLSVELSVGLSVGLSPFLSPSVSPGFTTRKKDYRVRRKNKLYSPNPVSILYLKALSSAFLIEKLEYNQSFPTLPFNA